MKARTIHVIFFEQINITILFTIRKAVKLGERIYYKYIACILGQNFI